MAVTHDMKYSFFSCVADRAEGGREDVQSIDFYNSGDSIQVPFLEKIFLSWVIMSFPDPSQINISRVSFQDKIVSRFNREVSFCCLVPVGQVIFKGISIGQGQGNYLVMKFFTKVKRQTAKIPKVSSIDYCDQGGNFFYFLLDLGGDHRVGFSRGGCFIQGSFQRLVVLPIVMMEPIQIFVDV